MAISNVNAIISDDIHKVWDIVFAVDKYRIWRSDLSKTEIINDKQFIEYTKDGYATTFSATNVEPYKRWEFDMENSNMKGHWIGIFTAKGNETQIDFTENVTPKKWFMKPLVKTYLKKQQKQFVLDLKKHWNNNSCLRRYRMVKVIKEEFVVIGKEGSTLDGQGFIQKLWDDANGHFSEVAHLAKKDANGGIVGIWGCYV